MNKSDMKHTRDLSLPNVNGDVASLQDTEKSIAFFCHYTRFQDLAINGVTVVSCSETLRPPRSYRV